MPSFAWSGLSCSVPILQRAAGNISASQPCPTPCPLWVAPSFSLFCIAAILPFLLFIIWHGWHLALGNWERELGASGLSYGLVTLALPVGGVLLTISFLRRLATAGPARLLEADTPANDAAASEEML